MGGRGDAEKKPPSGPSPALSSNGAQHSHWLASSQCHPKESQQPPRPLAPSPRPRVPASPHPSLRSRPIQVLVQERKRPDAVDAMRPVKELDLGPIADAELIVM